MRKIEPSEVKTETIIRTICLVIALVNQALAILGRDKIPITDDQVYQLVTIIVTIVVSVWTWWQNNSFTKAAIEADKYMEHLREMDRNGK